MLLQTAIAALAFAPAGASPLHGGGTLQWDAPEPCPSGASVAGLIDEHLRSNENLVALHATAVVRPAADGQWLASLVLRGSSGDASTRTLTVASCDAAAQAVALAVALAATPVWPKPEIEPEPEIEPSPIPEPRPEQEPPARDSDVPVAEPVRATQPVSATRSSGIRGFVSVGGGVAGAILPRPSGIVLVEGGVLGRRWQLAARADYVVRRPTNLPQRSAAGGVLSTFAGAVTAGPVFTVGPVEVPVQAGVTAGAIVAQGFGASRNETRAVPWAALLADAGVRWAPIPRLALGVRAELVVALVRHTFTLGDPFVVAHTGAVGGRGIISVSFRFP